MKKINVGIIGTGTIARFGHAPGYLRLPEKAKIVAVCDSWDALAKDSAKLWGAKKVYTDYRDLLKDDAVDVVDICLPHFLHAEVAVAAAEAGKNIGVQKPMCMNITEADSIIRAARKAGVKLSVNEMEVFYPPNVKARALIGAKEIGWPIMVRAAYRGFGRQFHTWISYDDDAQRSRTFDLLRKRPKPHQWRELPTRRGGGWGFDMLCHKFHYLQIVLGKFKTVTAFVEETAEDAWAPVTVMWKHEKGTIGIFDACTTPGMSVATDAGSVYGPYEFTGPNGMIWITCGGNGGVIERRAPVIMYKGAGPSVHFEHINWSYAVGFRDMIAHFVDYMLGLVERPAITGEEGKRVLQAQLAAYKSSDEGGRAINPDTITDFSWPWEK